jgi:hypothetical protein
MSKETERVLIYGMLKNAWNESTQGPIQWENMPFTQPTGGIWLAIFILDSESFQASLPAGTTLYRHPGIVQIDVLGPRDQGTKQLTDAIDLLTTIYRRKTVITSDGQHVKFKVPRTMNLGEQNGWWRYSFRVEFHREEYSVS